MEGVSAELKSAYFDSIKELKEGDIVKGKIVVVTPREVIVDVGYKSEGVISKDEFKMLEDLDKLEEIDVYVENVEDEDGKVILSFSKAKETKGWLKLSQGYKEGDLVEGSVVKKVKGGYIVSVFGVEGFLPQSLSAFKNLSDEEILNKKFNFQIVKMRRMKESFILSRRDALRIEKEQAREKLWESLEVGKIVKGRVKSIANFGAFIDLGGVDGLLHIADMSWEKISHPSEVVAVDDEVQVMVLNIDKEKGKVSLGLKQTTSDPWENLEKKYTVGSVIKGKIVNIQNYGVFVELEKGIKGLVHISEISWSKKFINLNEMFAIGDMVEAKIIGISPQERRISLSIKQLEKDPWENIEDIISIDSLVKGKVSGFGGNCTYVELENGLDGVVYNSDLSWTRRINKPQEILKRGQVYEFKVLGLDSQNRKVILGVKQIKENPWPQIIERYPIGKVVEAEVVKITSFGVFVKLEEELEGLVFSDEIEESVIQSLKMGDKLKVKIIKVSPQGAKIGLSAKIDEEKTKENKE